MHREQGERTPQAGDGLHRLGQVLNRRRPAQQIAATSVSVWLANSTPSAANGLRTAKFSMILAGSPRPAVATDMRVGVGTVGPPWSRCA
jgi:hypothetical protein